MFIIFVKIFLPKSRIWLIFWAKRQEVSDYVIQKKSLSVSFFFARSFTKMLIKFSGHNYANQVSLKSKVGEIFLWILQQHNPVRVGKYVILKRYEPQVEHFN